MATSVKLQLFNRFAGRTVALMTFAFCLLLMLQSSMGQLNQPKVDFKSEVAPLLINHCLKCHHGASAEGGFDLSSREHAVEGGDSGPGIIAGNWTDSLVGQRIESEEMPPDTLLAAAEIQTLRHWIDEGAKWEAGNLDPFAVSTDQRAGRDWWSLQPLQVDWKSSAATRQNGSIDGAKTIDRLIGQRLEKAGLEFSAEARPRTLLRRLYFDLTGLPPSPEELAAFEQDPSDAHYQEIVESLLASPHYGQRWARHWLDVVRFGESDGFERNVQRENAWPYRDWVIESLNSDLPYDQFVRRQLIGDLSPGGIEGAAATGFWVAGVHNTVVGGSERMRELARQDEIEDVLGTIGQTFLGLTLNCARCHDHKFDPITQKEYYQLATTISGLGFGEQTKSSPKNEGDLAAVSKELLARIKDLETLEERVRSRVLAKRLKEKSKESRNIPVAMARWSFDHDFNDQDGKLMGVGTGNPRIEDGALILDGSSFVATSSLPSKLKMKTLEVVVQLDTLQQAGGAAISVEQTDGNVFDAIVYGELDPGQWMSGSESFLRTDSFNGPEEVEATTHPVHLMFVYQKDGTILGYRNGQSYGAPIRKSELRSYPENATEVLFGLRHRPAGGNRFLKGCIHEAALYDHALSAREVAVCCEAAQDVVSEVALKAAMNSQEIEYRTGLRAEIQHLRQRHSEAKKAANPVIYTLVPEPAKIGRILLRGDPANPGPEVVPGATTAVQASDANFQLAADAPEHLRRQRLAQWITNPDNPLLARVITNRVWHYHFGAGMVATPNDFGFNGGLPSHPMLLDSLASGLKENGFSLKWLHRQIVTSKTYRQSVFGQDSEQRQKASQLDANNQLLWRGNSRRLEAEAIRDAMLLVAGQLNTSMGGPSFKDVSVTLSSGTTYYEPIEVDGEEFFRRTVYRFNPRGSRSALLDTFDCPDPASTTPKRTVTSTPLQSLSLLNNEFVIRISEYFAQRVKREAGEEIRFQVKRAWLLAIGREPDPTEQQLSESLVKEHGLSALCRGLFNLHEFIVIE